MIDNITNISPISNNNAPTSTTASNTNGSDFLSILKETINSVNQDQIQADQAMGSIATGTVKDLHQAAIAINKAELSMKMMLEVRNKALNAYKEILKTQM